MTRTRLTAALGLALFAAGCPAEKPVTPPPVPPSENLGTPEAGSSANRGAPVTPPAAPPVDPPAAPPADTPVAPPVTDPAAPATAPPSN